MGFVCGQVNLVNTRLKKINGETDSFYYQQSMGIDFVKSKKINCIVLRENIENGQNADILLFY